MTLKNAGREKSKRIEYTRCPYCKVKIDVQEAINDGYVEKIANCNIITCPHCMQEFND